MKLRMIGILVGLSAVAAWVGACNVTQPKPTCPVAHGAFVAKYTLKSKTGTGDCDKLPGEQLGFEKYNVPGTTENKLAIRAEQIGTPYSDGRLDPNDQDGKKVNSLGKLAYEPDTEGFCAGSDFSKAEQRFEAIPEELFPDGGVKTDAVPELYVAYEWKNFKVLSLSEAPGTQVKAELTFTQDTCTATYDVAAVWPPVMCEALDEDGKGTGKPDNAACQPKNGKAACDSNGSCMNSGFDVKCDPDLLYCVLASPPPAFTK